jgi:glucose/arabinose dehydrogenase
VLLGKILRIDPTPQTTSPYTIPFDNPFVKQAGARGEIWAYGLRNPWRFSFDKTDRGIWIADVGQQKWEEINHVERDPKGGQNYGWSLREGTHEFTGDKPKDAVDPVYEYDHSNGACSVTGGYVYRGKNIPAMTGRYIYADYCNGKVGVLTQKGTEWEAEDLDLTVQAVTSFAQDNDGELYTLAENGQISRIDAA